MQKAGEYGLFFPGTFAANAYDESWSGLHFPLSDQEQTRLGFRSRRLDIRPAGDYLSAKEVPDDVDAVTANTLNLGFWDEIERRPFKLTMDDLKLCRILGCPPPDTYYARRLKDNYQWLHFDGALRQTVCSRCQATIETTKPAAYDNRILCEKDYLRLIG